MPAQSTQRCTKAWLVSLEFPIPSDPSAAYGGPPIFGCNHLVCRRCGAAVKHADHRSVPSIFPPDNIKQLYDSPHPEQSPQLEGGDVHATSRAYFCRCAWTAVNFSSAKDVEDLEQQDWECGGHPAAGPGGGGGGGGGKAKPAAKPGTATVAQAQQVTAEAAKRYVDVANAKIRFKWAVNVEPAFATAAELRDALLASYPDASYFQAPVVGRNRDETAPAWGWVPELIRQRTDWWPALGVALQHAAKEGGDLARTALATLLADCYDTLALLPWTAPVAQAEAWPNKAPGAGTGWGMPECTLQAIVRDQEKTLGEIRGDATAFLDGYGKGGAVIQGPFAGEADLKTLLAESAQAGQFPDGKNGPWSWLGSELVTGEAWLRPALKDAILTIDASDETQVLAMLDWFFEERDLWQYAPLLQGWDEHHPAWWDKPASTKPSGWRYDMRSAHWPDVATIGDVVVEAMRRGHKQVATPPVADLPALYGAGIS